MYSYTAPRQGILDYKDCLVGDACGWRGAELVEGRKHGKSIIVRLGGVDDRDTAEQLVGLDIGVPRAELPEVSVGEYYWTDLEGLQVVHRGQRRLGTVSHLLETGANDVLVVRDEDGMERLIPFVQGQVILDVDLAEGVIKVDWKWD